MVGIALGRQRFGHGLHRRLMSSLGWVAAMGLHITFNSIVRYATGLTALILLVGIGLAGLALVAVFIFWGLSEEKRWLRESLNLKVGVSAGESEVVQKMDNLDALLAPIAETFGQQKRKDVETFLRLQAQLGLKVKVQALSTDTKLNAELIVQIAGMRVQMDALRRAVGVYCMSYVRMIIPTDVVSMYVQLESMEVKDTFAKGSMWSALQS